MSGSGRRALLVTFKASVLLLFGMAAFSLSGPSTAQVTAATVLALLALLPAYLWCAGRVQGLPVFPVFALTFLWTYAAQFVDEHPVVDAYPVDAQMRAATTAGVFLVLATLAWLAIVAPRRASRSSYLVLDFTGGPRLFLAAVLAAAVYRTALTGGWLILPAGVNSLLRATLMSLAAVGVFVLCYLAGRGELSRRTSTLARLAVAAYILANAASLLLVGALTTAFLALAGYAIGRGRVPHVTALVGLAAIAFLHYGKGEMRTKYWESGTSVQPWEYPAMLVEWTGHSLGRLWEGGESAQQEAQPFLERAGLLHLLLLAQDQERQGLAPLDGATYAVIPPMLVPRFIVPDKPASHAGTHLLNIHYGLQRPEDFGSTTIGWGLLNEAYANFGMVGVLVLAVLLGAALGIVTRWSAGSPPLSFRFLFTILVISLAVEVEFTLAVVVTVLFQYSVPLVALALVAGRVGRVVRAGDAAGPPAPRTARLNPLRVTAG